MRAVFNLTYLEDFYLISKELYIRLVGIFRFIELPTFWKLRLNN